jgi:hypothetical protein
MFDKIDKAVTIYQTGKLMLGQATTATGASSLHSALNFTHCNVLGDIATAKSGAVAAEAAQFVG